MGNIKALIVTKNEELLEDITKGITEFNFEIHESNSFPKALAIIAHEKIELLLLDFAFRQKPRKVEFIKQLSKHTPTHVPFIFLIDNDDDYHIIEETEIPQTHYRIQKVLMNGELQLTLNLILNS